MDKDDIVVRENDHNMIGDSSKLDLNFSKEFNEEIDRILTGDDDYSHQEN